MGAGASGSEDLPRKFAAYELADRFRLEDGRVFLSGVRRSPGCRSTSCASTAAGA